MWSKTTTITPVAPAYISVNLKSGRKLIVPADQFKGIEDRIDECKVRLAVFFGDGSMAAYIDTFEIDRDEYDRIAEQLGFVRQEDQE